MEKKVQKKGKRAIKANNLRLTKPLKKCLLHLLFHNYKLMHPKALEAEGKTAVEIAGER